MRYIESRGKRIPAMTLGTVQLGLNYGIANQEGKPSREKSYAMLRSALEHGVTSWDTAMGYGESERILGDFLRAQWQGERPVLTTKCRLSSPENASPSVVEKEMIGCVEGSLERLGVPKVDYLLLHQASDMWRYGDVVPRTMERMGKRGYFDTAGVSVYYGEEIESMLKNPLYAAVQLPMGVLDQRIVQGGYLERLRERGVDVFVRSVFQQGLCFMQPDAMEDELRACAAAPVKKLKNLAECAQMSVAQFAVSFVRDLPGVSSLVLGADNPEQVRHNAALTDGPAIPQDIAHEAFAAFGDVDYEGIMTVLRRGKPQPAVG